MVISILYILIMSESKSTIAVFDFDKTLTTRDSLFPFLWNARGFISIFLFLCLSPYFLGYLLGLLTRQKIKEKALTRFFGGWELTRLKKLGCHYANERLDRYLRPQAMNRLVWHQKQGHRCILVSASLELYLIPWAERYGFEKAIATQLEISNGKITGRIQGSNCWGPEKKNRLLAYLGSDAIQELYVYGDSRGDKELLECAQYPFYRKFD